MKVLHKIILILFLLVVYKVLPNRKEVVFHTASFHIQLNDSLLVKSLHNVEKLYQEKKIDSALYKAFILLDSSRNNNRDVFYKTNYLIGNIFYETLSFKDGVKYFRNNVNSILNDSIYLDNDVTNYDVKLLLVQNYLRLGSCYHKLKERELSKGKGKLQAYRDSTLYYYNKVIAFNDLDKRVLDTKAMAYSNLSAFYINDSLYVIAKKYAIKSIEIHKVRKDKINQATALGNLASMFLLQEAYKLAKTT